MRRHQRQTKRAFRNAPFPLYGLPSPWTGLRVIGGYGWTSGIGTSRLSLMHRSDAGHRASVVLVEVSREPAAANFHKADLEDWVSLRDDYEGDPIRESEWKPILIPIGGQRVEFETIRGDDDRWGGLSRRDGLVIKIEAHRFSVEDVSLVEISDVEPYLRVAPSF